jgi:hypothetical protein
MPAQSINREYDNIELIRKRLREAKSGRKKSDSIASLVEVLRDDIAAQRERGLTWQAIAVAILQDEAKQAAIRSAYQRLPPSSRNQAGRSPSPKARTKAATAPADQEAQAHERPAKTTRFDTTPIVDTYGSDDNY